MWNIVSMAATITNTSNWIWCLLTSNTCSTSSLYIFYVAQNNIYDLWYYTMYHVSTFYLQNSRHLNHTQKQDAHCKVFFIDYTVHGTRTLHIALCKFSIGFCGIKKIIQYIFILYDKHWTEYELYGIIVLCITITSIIIVHWGKIFQIVSSTKILRMLSIY